MYQPAASTVSTPPIQHATEIENFEAQLLKKLSNSKIVIKENIQVNNSTAMILNLYDIFKENSYMPLQ